MLFRLAALKSLIFTVLEMAKYVCICIETKSQAYFSLFQLTAGFIFIISA